MKYKKKERKRNIEFKLIFNLNLVFKLFYFIIKISFIKTDGCFITNNSIINSQWLNDIICLGDDNMRYVNFATFQNGDMVVEATSIPDSPKRMFYGITRDGESLFGENLYYKTIIISGQTYSNNSRYEGEIFIVPINDKDYLFSIGKGNNKYAELLDLNNGETKSQIRAITFLSATQINSVLNVATSYKDNNNYYYFFPFINKDSSVYNFYLKKMYFSSTNIDSNNPVVKTYSLENACGKSISCFTTDSNHIICLFNYDCIGFNLNPLLVYTSNLYIGIYSSNLNKIAEIPTDYFMYDITSDFPFFSKCVHLEGKTGAFIFYKSTILLTGRSMDTFPTIIFKTYDGGTSLNDYFSSIPYVELSRKEFKDTSLLNDLVKISNNKLCFISTSTTKEILYIVLLNLINREKIILRYYTINIFSKYTFKFLGDIRLHLYNNYVAFGFSFCRQRPCESKTDLHYAGFMLFSYPNGTDYYLNLKEYLFNNNNIKIHDLKIDLKENIKIDNNVFGLTFSNIKIKEINNCNNINFFSSLNINTYIEVNSSINENEKIKVSFNSYNIVQCLIKYIYIITEPDFDKYNSYSERIYFGREDTESEFTKDTYQSRILDYYIIIEENFQTVCTDHNCDLCLEENQNYCITCKYNYSIYNNGNNTKNKICYPNDEIDKTTQIEDDATQLIETTQINDDTSQLIETIQINDDTTQLIETIQINDNTTQLIETTQINDDTTQLIETIQINDDTTQLIETTQLKIDTTQLIETTQLKIDTTQIINHIQIKNFITEEIIKNEDDPNSCLKEEIIKNECKDGKMSDAQVDEIYNAIKEKILTEDYKGENTIVQTENVIFQVSTLEDQKNNDYPNISTIDLGECENILKSKYNISKEDSLIVVKTDIKSSDLSSTYVQYEIYDPITLKPLDMNFCNNVKIIVSVPVNLEDNTVSLYESLSQSGYNLFDSGDDFYNDICSTFTSLNGTDMTLTDRKNEIFSEVGNISMCQTGCIFESYNKTNKKANCNCDVQTNTTETNISKIEFSSINIADSFISTLKNSNFLVLKCYKLALNLKNIINNKGRIIMTIIYFFFLICLLIYIIKDRKKINIFINLILKNKGNLFKNIKNKLNHKEENKNIKSKNNIKKIKENNKIENKDKLNKKNEKKNKNEKKKEKEKKDNKNNKIGDKKKKHKN